MDGPRDELYPAPRKTTPVMSANAKDHAASPIGDVILFGFWTVVGTMTLALIVFFLTMILFTPGDLVAVAKSDRTVQKWESVPVLWFPWGFYAGNLQNIPEVEDQFSRFGGEEKKPLGAVLGGWDSLGTKHLNEPMKMLPPYWAVISGRTLSLAGILPGLAGLMGIAWGLGRSRNALIYSRGEMLSTNIYSKAKNGFGVCIGLVFSYPFWPVSLPLAVVLVPAACGFWACFYLRKHRA